MSYQNNNRGGRGGSRGRGGRGAARGAARGGRGGGRGGFGGNRNSSGGSRTAYGGSGGSGGSDYDGQYDYSQLQNQQWSDNSGGYGQQQQVDYSQQQRQYEYPQQWEQQPQWDHQQPAPDYSQQAPPPTDWPAPPVDHSQPAIPPQGQPPFVPSQTGPTDAFQQSGVPPLDGAPGPVPGPTPPLPQGDYNNQAPPPQGEFNNPPPDQQAPPPPHDFNNGAPGEAPQAEYQYSPQIAYDAPVPRGEYDELLSKHRNLRDAFDTLSKKYQKLKDQFKQEKENHEKREHKWRAKLRQVEGITVESANLPREKGKFDTNDNKSPGEDGGDDEANKKRRLSSAIEVETPKSTTKDKYQVNASSSNVIKSERDLYKKKLEALNHEYKKIQEEKKKINEKNIDLETEVEKVKAQIQEVVTEKAELLEKYEQSKTERAIGSPINSDDEEENIATVSGDDKQKLKELYRRKEFYKNKYNALLEEQNKEQKNYMLVNKMLLEKYVFGA